MFFNRELPLHKFTLYKTTASETFITTYNSVSSCLSKIEVITNEVWGEYKRVAVINYVPHYKNETQIGIKDMAISMLDVRNTTCIVNRLQV